MLLHVICSTVAPQQPCAIWLDLLCPLQKTFFARALLHFEQPQADQAEVHDAINAVQELMQFQDGASDPHLCDAYVHEMADLPPYMLLLRTIIATAHCSGTCNGTASILTMTELAPYFPLRSNSGMPHAELRFCEALLNLADQVVACDEGPGSCKAGCKCRLQLQAVLRGSVAALHARLPLLGPAQDAILMDSSYVVVSPAAQAPRANKRRIVIMSCLAPGQRSSSSLHGTLSLAFDADGSRVSLSQREDPDNSSQSQSSACVGLLKHSKSAIAEFVLAARDWVFGGRPLKHMPACKDQWVQYKAICALPHSEWECPGPGSCYMDHRGQGARFCKGHWCVVVVCMHLR